jgi:hypothetical protein
MPRQPEHALHRQFAELLTLQIAPAGKLSPAGASGGQWIMPAMLAPLRVPASAAASST